MRLCTKCSETLNDNQIFCPNCGTKHYISDPNMTHESNLLVKIPMCKLYVLGILPVECMLYVKDNSIMAGSQNNKKIMMDIPFPKIESIEVNKMMLCIRSSDKKQFQIEFPPLQKDFVYYVKEMIEDYKEHHFETTIGTAAWLNYK